MVVPHQGQSVMSVRLPIQALKIAAATVGTLALIAFGVFINYRMTVSAAAAERDELAYLRQVNATQLQKLDTLAKTTAVLQEDMNRLNALDADVRKLIGTEESSATSRAGLYRPTTGATVPGGQGGPVAHPKVDELLQVVGELQAAAKEREQSLVEAKDALEARNSRAAATPSIWPSTGDVTSRFGWRSSPWGGGSDWHPGIDIADGYGTPIQSTADGVIVFSGWYSGYGQMIKVDHGYGIETVYAHNSRNLVDVGDKVRKGQTIAYMGSTGNSTGTHVHYEVRVNGTQVNPAKFLQ